MERQYLIHYNTANESSTPTSDNLQYGELAVRYAKDAETIFMKNNENEIVSFGVSDAVLENTIEELRNEIPSIDGFATEEYVNNKVAALVSGAPETLDTLGELATALKDNSDIVTVLNDSIASKADKSEIPSLDGYATQSWVEEQNYLTEHQSLTHLATKAELSGYSETNHTHSEYITEHQDISNLATKDEFEQSISSFNEELNQKQDVITDLEEIKRGAALGATAVQPNSLNETLTDFVKTGDLSSITSQITALQEKIAALEQQIQQMQS